MSYDIVWKPQPGPQTEFLSRKEFEVGYGGAAGGGKSDALLGDASRFIDYPDYRAVLFRRTYKQLSEGGALIDRSQSIYRKLGGDYKEAKFEWHFPSGAKILFRHMEHEHNKFNYQGAQYHFVGFDEATQFTETQYKYLMSRCRSANQNIIPRVRSATNPGNIGHLWYKERFVDNGPYRSVADVETGLHRIFIPARVYDNAYFNPEHELCTDPNYVKRLMMLNEEERRMLLEGDWDIFAGQFFDRWRSWLHVVDTRKNNPRALIGDDWDWFCGVDYGGHYPFVWIEGAIGYNTKVYDERPIVYITREYWAEGKTPQHNAREVVKRMGNKKYRWKAIGKDVRKKAPQKDEADSDVTLQDLLEAEGMEGFEYANDNRKQGWALMRELLEWEGTQDYVSVMPRLRIFDNCSKLISTLPSLVKKDSDLDDIDKNSGLDDWADATRYGLMTAYSVLKLKDNPEFPEERRFKRKLSRFKVNTEYGGDRGYLT